MLRLKEMQLMRQCFLFKFSNQVEKQNDCTLDDLPTHPNSSKALSRISLKGDYHKYECKIQVDGISIDDDGSWKCDMESYVFGPFRGTLNTKTISINVFQKQLKSQPKSKMFQRLKSNLRNPFH